MDSLALPILAIPFFIIAKILTQDWKFNLKESLYIVLSSLAFAIAILIHISLRRAFPHIIESATTLAALNMFGSAVLRTLLFLYFYRMKSYSAKESFILMFLASVVGVLVEHFIGFSVLLLFPTFLATMALWQLVLYLVSISIVAIFSAFLLLLLSRGPRNMIARDIRLQSILVGVSVFILISMQVLTVSWRYQEHALVFFSWNTIFLLGSILASFGGFFIYAKMLTQKFTILQKEIEQKNLAYYTQQIEQQQTAMRKFKHDYQNILLSINSFVKEKDWAGLEQYMPKVETASALITEDNFALENLSNIKPPEIKGLLAAKLMMAQNISMDIHTTFEAQEEIDRIPFDSVVLVRMLGIILDNAIEELTALGEGTLMVACWSAGNGVTFVVQNTCRADMPKLHELEQLGFSTKGDGRGLGLNNLAEITAAHPDNITLQTSIKDGNFIQKLRIGGAG